MNIISFLLELIAPEATLLLRAAKVLRMDPKKFVGALKAKPAAVIKRINELPNRLKKQFAELTEEVAKGNPLGVAEKLGALTSKERKAFSETQDALTRIDETKSLSSS